MLSFKRKATQTLEIARRGYQRLSTEEYLINTRSALTQSSVQ